MLQCNRLICSDFLAENLSHTGSYGMEAYSPNFVAAIGFPKMLADLILHSKRHI